MTRHRKGDAAHVEPTAARWRRLPASERKRQIIDAVFEVASQHGIPGTTIARVAEAAGVGIGTVYRHFDDQRAMLQAAAETLSERLMGTIPENWQGSALDFVRYMGERHYDFVSDQGGYYAGLWLEFVAASQRLDLHETILKTQVAAIEAVRAMCEHGKADGSIRADIDVDLFAYRILEQAWGVDMTVLIGLDERYGRGFQHDRIGALIDSIAAS
jgi:AcrR family transcriptional regulator